MEISQRTLRCLEELTSDLAKYQFGLDMMIDCDMSEPELTSNFDLWFGLLQDLVSLANQQIGDLCRCVKAISSGSEFF